MAQMITVTKNVKITDGGSTVVDQEFSNEQEIQEYSRSTATVQGGDSSIFCVKGTDLVGLSDPMVLPLTKIRGYAIDTDMALGVKEDGAAVAVPSGPGQGGKDNTSLDTIEFENNGGLPAHIKFIIWGDR